MTVQGMSAALELVFMWTEAPSYLPFSRTAAGSLFTWQWRHSSPVITPRDAAHTGSELCGLSQCPQRLLSETASCHLLWVLSLDMLGNLGLYHTVFLEFFEYCSTSLVLTSILCKMRNIWTRVFCVWSIQQRIFTSKSCSFIYVACDSRLPLSR